MKNKRKLRPMPGQDTAGAQTKHDGYAASWTCFHCGETLTTKECARDHFGDSDGCIPACIVNGQQGVVKALRKAESQNWRLQDRIEVLECSEDALRYGYGRIGGATDAYSAFCNYDTMEGRAIAAEALVAEIQSRWPALVGASRRRAGNSVRPVTIKEVKDDE